MKNLQNIMQMLFVNKRTPRILTIAPNNEVLQKFIYLLEKYSDNTTIIVNIEEGHFKFWLYEELDRRTIRYVWGKIGGTAAIKDINESIYDADAKRYTKLRKGYEALI